MPDYRVFDPKEIAEEQRAQLYSTLAQYDSEVPLLKSRALRRLAYNTEKDNPEFAENMKLAVAASTLADLSEQNWIIKLVGQTNSREIVLETPSSNPLPGETVYDVKERIRRGLMVASNRQLASKPVSDFLKSMERERVHNGKVVSIKSLFDDGTELLNSYEAKQKDFGKVFKPQIQICEADSSCEFTGLKLLDVWRYCRLTWSLEYNPIPGRTFRVLIRNRARPNSPIVGIAMLASPAANYFIRDKWIGWRVDEIANAIVNDELDPRRIAKALLTAIDESIRDLRSDDLVEPEELSNPTDQTFFKLDQIRFKAEVERREDLLGRNGVTPTTNKNVKIDIRDFDKSRLTKDDWRALSETALFRKKRSEQLVALLKARKQLRQIGFEKAPAAAICEALVHTKGQRVVAFALNEIRKRKISSEVADVSVCGAIAPYNHLLSGKLVALLMLSREIQSAYRNRYTGQVSEISSQIAGKEVCRPAELRVLTTTSLYGIASSQYNRLRIKKDTSPFLDFDLEWKELEKTTGTTVTHLSKLTLSYMKRLAELSYGARRINSVFGEGSSPRMRQVREGLKLIGVNDDHILEQGLPRRVYVAEVYPDARNDLHGFDRRPKRRSGIAASKISKAWIFRWAQNRIENEEISEKIRRETPSSIPKRQAERIQLALSEGQLFDNDSVSDVRDLFDWAAEF